MLASPSKRATKPKVSFSIISAKYTLWLLCLSVLLISVECSSGSNDGANGLQSSSSTPTNQQQANNNKPQQPQAAQDNKPFYEPPKRQSTDDEYLIGVGLADITGPAADINLMGYAKPTQDAGGIHLRQFSRSIIVEDKQGQRILYTSIDNGMISQLLRIRVLEKLKQNYGAQMYNESNVMMTATHSHSCPGGFFQYMLYNIPSAGYISQTLEALVDGIVRSVERANDNMRPGRIYFSQGELVDASVNRSPTSYANNPADERASYKYNTDKGMYLLKMVDSQTGQPMAMLNWFAVHGTSMNNSNHLISSDNKGYASLLFEQEFNPPGTLPGKGKFVAIFAQANEGDVSPNTMGPRCIDTGLPCDMASSTCGSPPRNEKCIASGPGKDMFESTKIIAYKQYNKARQLFLDDRAQQLIRGPVRFIHEHIDMTKQIVPVYKSLFDLAKLQQPHQPMIALNQTYQTCPAGLGYSFAAGTTDGPGAFDFQQGDTASTRYWNMVRDFLRRPSETQIKCHHPKPILLSTGEMDFPYMWHPKVVPTQILMIGQLAIVGLPGEFTTMAGRRVRQVVQSTLQGAATRGTTPAGLFDNDAEIDDDDADDDDETKENERKRKQQSGAGDSIDLSGDISEHDIRFVTPAGSKKKPVISSLSRHKRANSLGKEIKVVLSGLSNIYTSYVTTVEEYEVQRYEGASTLYGPHTLQAYINQFHRLSEHLISGEQLNPTDQIAPPDLSKSLFTFKTGVIYDGTQNGRSFGDVLNDVDPTRVYKCQEVVSVSFVAGNPRNDLRQEDSFLYVDKYIGKNDNWQTVATDASWETKFVWERTNTIFGESKVTIVWEIPHQCQSGVYRIRHYGAHKSLMTQTVSQYAGQSAPFKVSSAEQAEELKTQLDEELRQAVLDNQLAVDRKRLGSDGQQPTAGNNNNKPTNRPSLFYSPMQVISSWFGPRN